jgi:hypothetical protein
MNAQAEIDFLERLYALPSGRENMEMENDSSINRLAAAVLNDIERAAAQVGKEGFHCFFCGFDMPTSTCRCQHPESFRCMGKHVCAGCEKAMLSIASHIDAVCRQKPANRVTSIRQRMYFELMRAARSVGKEEIHEPTELHFCLAQADPWDDAPRDFRTNLLGAFSRCGFTQFQELAAALEKEGEATSLRLFVRALGN